MGFGFYDGFDEMGGRVICESPIDGRGLERVFSTMGRIFSGEVDVCFIGRFADLISQVFLTDMKDFAEMNTEYEKWFTHKPARTCVAVHQLPKGVPVEIEAIALQ